MTPAAFLNAVGQALAGDAGLILLVLLILFLGARKTWVWGYQMTAKDAQLTDERIAHMAELSAQRTAHTAELNQMREERDQWRRMSLYQQGQRGPGPPPPNPLEGD